MRADKREYQNLLIVEGPDDKHAVIGLMKFHTNWPEAPKEWPVFIEVGNGVDEILKTGYLSAEIKARHVKVVGVVLDADLDTVGRYERIQQLTTALFPNIPATFPENGLVVDNDDGKRFGVWIMPDNKGVGGLETFLRHLLPSDAEHLWKLACDSVSSARQSGAACRDSHIAKANLYTWLAWQDPPGQSPGLALTRVILDAQSPNASAFVVWFKNLFLLS